MAASPAIRIECFGEPRLVVGGQDLRLGGKQPVTLAVLVAAGPSGISKTGLYNVLFGDEPPASGEQSALMRVRRLQEKIATATDEPAILLGRRFGLNPAVCSVDVWDFERSLKYSTSGWETLLFDWGEPFAGLAELPEPVLVAIEHLRTLYRSALTRIDWTGDDHDSGLLVELVLGELGGDPFNEGLAASAAIGLYRSGRQTAALECLAAYRERLLEVHGLDPGSRVDEVEHAILTHGLNEGMERASAQTTSQTPARLASPRRFVGRQLVLAELDRVLQALPSPAGQNKAPNKIHVVCGPAGSGKSTLLARLLAHRQESGLVVRVGSASVDGGRSNDQALYRPFLEAMPDLRGFDLEASGTSGLQSRLAFWKAVHTHMQVLAQASPTVLVLEDMHDSDSPSAALVRLLAGAAQPQNLVTLITTREPIAGTAWSEIYDALTESPDRVEVHRLGPLGLDDVQELVALDHPARPLVVRERFARSVHVASVGNAMVASALSRDALGDLDLPLLPEKISPEETYFEHVRAKVQDPDMQQILCVASLIGLEFEADRVAQVLDLEPGRVVSTLELAGQLHLCDRLGLRRWRFDHPLTVASFARMVGLLRPMLFAKLARAGTDSPLRMLRYIAGAGDEVDEEFRIDKLRWAAVSLESQGAFDESALAWKRLAELLPDTGSAKLEALIGAAGSFSRIGRGDEAEAFRSESVRLARSAGEGRHVFAAALAGLPSGEHVGGEHDRLEILSDMTATERAQVAPVEFARWHLRFARVCDDPEQARSVIESIDQSWAGDIEQWSALRLEQLSFEAQCRAPRRILAELRELVELCPDGPERADLMHRVVLNALVEQRPADELVREVERSASYARVHGSPRTRWSTDALAAVLAMVGMIRSAATPTTARSSGYRWGIRDVEDNFHVQTFMELFFAGNVGLAQAVIVEVRDRIAMNVAWHAGLALSAATNGDARTARREARAVCDELSRQPDGAWAPAAAALLAETAYELDDASLALAAQEALAPRSGLALVLGIGAAHFGPVDRYLALVAAVLGSPRLDELSAAAREQASRTGFRWREPATV